MTVAVRALLGASLSALLTLCIHPASRPYMLGLVSTVTPADLRDTVDSNAQKLTEPANLPEAGLWMQFAADRMTKRQKFTDKEWTSLMDIAQAAQKREVTNAVWPEMQAALYDYVGKEQLARQAWIDASGCTDWNDWQNTRLQQSKKLIEDLTGEDQSWQCAFLYYQRSNTMPEYLGILAKRLLIGAPTDTVTGMRFRLATLLNGDQMRSHARSTKANIVALNIVEVAPLSQEELAKPIGPKPLITAQDRLAKNISVQLHDPDSARHTFGIFAEAEAYRALTVHDFNDQYAQILSAASVFTSSIASAFAVVAAIGLVIWLIGRLVAWRLAQGKEIKWYAAAPIAVGMGLLTGFLTRDAWTGFATSLCAVFLTVAPDRSRKAKPTNIGPLFVFLAMVLGVVFSGLLAAYLIGSTPQATVVLPRVGVPSNYFDKPLLAGLASVSLGLVLLIAPIWAVVHKLGTPYVLALTLMRFGSFVAAMGLCLSIVLGPLSIYIDRRLETNLYQILTNEPQHYRIQA